MIPRVLLYCLIVLPGVSFAADSLRVGYVSGVEPGKAGISSGAYDRATGRVVDWRRFDNGAEVVRALAAGDLDIGNLGSSVVAVAAARQLPLETFLIASELGASEALVARRASGIRGPADLAGRTVAVPFVSTAHYSLLSALKHWGIAKDRVHSVNLRISEIPAAWSSGNIDAAYVWDPALGSIAPTGIVLANSADVASWGAPSFDVWVVRTVYGANNPAVVAAFAGVALDLMQRYTAAPTVFAADTDSIQRIVRATGANAADVPGLLRGNQYPGLARQRELLSHGYPDALAHTAEFLKEQGKVDGVLADYHGYSTARYLPGASSAGTVSAPAIKK